MRCDFLRFSSVGRKHLDDYIQILDGNGRRDSDSAIKWPLSLELGRKSHLREITKGVRNRDVEHWGGKPKEGKYPTGKQQGR